MRAPNWTWGISAGLLFVGTIGVIKIFQNPSVRENPTGAISDFANGFAKRYRDQMSDPSSDAPSGVASGYSASAYTPSANLIATPPSSSTPICPLCGGDSRYCVHSRHNAVVAAPGLSGVQFRGANVVTTFDRYVDYYYPVR